MFDFTYEKPDEQAYFNALVEYLRVEKKNEILDLLMGGRCAIQPSINYSGRRWGAFSTEIHFYVPASKLKLVNKGIASTLTNICNIVMPSEIGLDVTNVEFKPLITQIETKKTLFEDLEETTNTLSQDTISQILPDDIKQKGKEMAEAYLYLYCVENSLRLFIEKVARDKLGNNYFDQLELNRDIKKKIQDRKQEESKNIWLRLRGDSELFYLDFLDLGTVIQNNWELFEQYFPDQKWILSKIDEFSECRNLVAHNSYIESHEKDVIRVNYNSILKQLNITY